MRMIGEFDDEKSIGKADSVDLGAELYDECLPNIGGDQQEKINQRKSRSALKAANSMETLGAYLEQLPPRGGRVKISSKNLLNRMAEKNSNTSMEHSKADLPSATPSKELQDIRQRIKTKFLKSKKLPANTPQKYGQTTRINFSRRQDMEHRPLIVITFNEILGYFDSYYLPNDKEHIGHKLFIKKGIAQMIETLLSKCQVALFIDVRCHQTAQWIKGNVIQNQEYLFDGIYTFNQEYIGSQRILNLEQILQDFDFTPNKILYVLQPYSIDQEELLKQKAFRPDQLINQASKYNLEFTTVHPYNLFYLYLGNGQINGNEALLAQIIDSEDKDYDFDVDEFDQIRYMKVIQRQHIDLKLYYQKAFPKSKISPTWKDQQVTQTARQLQARATDTESQVCDNPNTPSGDANDQLPVKDFRVDNEFNTLKDKNQLILAERKKYQIQFYSKYSVLAQTSPEKTHPDAHQHHVHHGGNELFASTHSGFMHQTAHSLGAALLLDAGNAGHHHQHQIVPTHSVTMYGPHSFTLPSSAPFHNTGENTHQHHHILHHLQSPTSHTNQTQLKHQTQRMNEHQHYREVPVFFIGQRKQIAQPISNFSTSNAYQNQQSDVQQLLGRDYTLAESKKIKVTALVNVIDWIIAKNAT